MKLINFGVAILAVLAPAMAISQSINRAKDLIAKQQYKQAAIELRPLAEKGDAEAQTLAAQLFYDGKGVIKSKEQGNKYATLAADQGYVPAVQLLARQFENANDIKGEVALITAYSDKFESVASSELRIRLSELYRDHYAALSLTKTEGVEKGWSILRPSGIGYQLLQKAPHKWFKALMEANNYSYADLGNRFATAGDFLMETLCDYVTDASQNPSAMTEEECLKAAESGDHFYCALLANRALYKNGRDKKQNVAEARKFLSKADAAEAPFHPYFYYVKNDLDNHYLPGDRINGHLVYEVDPGCRGAFVATEPMYYYNVPKLKDFHELDRTWRWPTAEERNAIEKFSIENQISSHNCVSGCLGNRDNSKKRIYPKEVLVTEVSDGPSHTRLSYPGASTVIGSVKRVWNLGYRTRVDIHLWWAQGKNPAPDKTPFSKDAVLTCKGKDYNLIGWSYTTTPRIVESNYKDADMTLYFERIPDDWTALSISMPGCWNIPTVKWRSPNQYE